jgi:hypothetical protein
VERAEGAVPHVVRRHHHVLARPQRGEVGCLRLPGTAGDHRGVGAGPDAEGMQSDLRGGRSLLAGVSYASQPLSSSGAKDGLER